MRTTMPKSRANTAPAVLKSSVVADPPGLLGPVCLASSTPAKPGTAATNPASTSAASSAAALAVIAPAMRKLIILAKIDRLQHQEPADITSWDYQKIKDFGADVAQLVRLQRGPLSHVLRISERIARCYGVTMDQIDPCHGEAA